MATTATAQFKPWVRAEAVWNPITMGGALGCADFLASSISIFIGFRVWSCFNPLIPPVGPAMVLAPLLTIAAFARAGLYPGLGLTAVSQMKRASNSLTLVYLFLTAAMYMAKDRWVDSRGEFFLAWLVSLAAVPWGRWIFTRVMIARGRWGVPVLIVGAGTAAEAVIASLRQNRILGYKPVACVAEDSQTMDDCHGVPVAGTLPDIAQVARLYGAQHAIVAIPSLPPDRLAAHMRSWSRIFPRILIVPNLADIGSLWIEPKDLGGLLALEIQNNLLQTRSRMIKRAADISGSAFGLLVSAPLIGLAALFIKWRSPGKAFYTQEREGKDGRIIRVLKLRSMHPNAEKILAAHLALDEQARSEWERFCKLRFDPRVIPVVGHFIRRSSIDELPQLWNVLKGEMSLVGPRPFPAYHNRRLEPGFRDLRTQVMPGLTGLWQVTSRDSVELTVPEKLDAYYIRNWSLWLDIYILIRTARAVVMPASGC